MSSIIIKGKRKFPQSSTKRRRLSDQDWVQEICYFLVRCNFEIDKNEVRKKVQHEEIEKSKKENGKAQREITVCIEIVNWLESNHEFCYSVGHGDSKRAIGFIVDREFVKGKGRLDIIVRHGDWAIPKHFPIECKCLGHISQDISEYVYNSSKPDGGVYRYLTGKYAYDSDFNTTINFGGMIGFLLKGNIERTIDAICDKLQTEKYGKENYLEPTITRQSIENQPFTFDSSHQRFIAQKPDADPILLHHIIMDFS